MCAGHASVMRLVLALPHLLALDPAILAAMPGLARIAAVAGMPATVPGGIEAAWAQAAGSPADASLAQLAALGAGFDPGAAPVLFADPVTFVAGRDDVLYRGRVDDLAEADARTLVALLNAHFGPDGVAFHAPRADTWFVTAETARTLTTTPPAALRGAIYPHLPRGDAAKTWRQWLSEMQMLLHEHAINAAREGAALAPVTGVWVWGGGRQDWSATLPEAFWIAPEGRAGDLVRGLARRAQSCAVVPPRSFPDLNSAAAVHAVLATAHNAADAAALDAAWLTPAEEALLRGDIASIVLIADAGGAALQWRAYRPPFIWRVRHRFGVPPFALPALESEA